VLVREREKVLVKEEMLPESAAEWQALATTRRARATTTRASCSESGAAAKDWCHGDQVRVTWCARQKRPSMSQRAIREA
jgi:hypothetical protein